MYQRVGPISRYASLRFQYLTIPTPVYDLQPLRYRLIGMFLSFSLPLYISLTLSFPRVINLSASQTICRRLHCQFRSFATLSITFETLGLTEIFLEIFRRNSISNFNIFLNYDLYRQVQQILDLQLPKFIYLKCIMISIQNIQKPLPRSFSNIYCVNSCALFAI